MRPMNGEHMWVQNPVPGAWNIETQAEQEMLYADVVQKMIDLNKTQGLEGAIYTEICDYEGETGGLLTYDRKIVKNRSSHDQSNQFAAFEAGAIW